MLAASRRLRLEKRESLFMENSAAYSLEKSKLIVFEAYQASVVKELQTIEPMIATIIQGKMVMRFPQRRSVECVPYQWLMLPAETTVCMDFPEASLSNPARCLILKISPSLIESVAADLNARSPKIENDDGRLGRDNFYFSSDPRVAQTVSQLVQIFVEAEPAKETLASLKLRELLVRVLQTQARSLLVERHKMNFSGNRVAAAIDYIKTHLHELISIDDLCKKSCMSRPHFFRKFKQELGVTPIEFINRVRIERAKELLAQPSFSVSEACFRTGFSSMAYFDRVFKKNVGLRPKQYQNRVAQKNKSLAKR